MAITKQITQAPEAPQRSDPDTFADKADAFVAWLEDFANDLVDWTNQVNITAEEINLCLETTETARDEALAIVNAEVYDSNKTYNYPDVVIGSDGHCYRCLGENVQGDDPVGSSTGNWLKLTLSADDVEDFVTEKISEKLPPKEIVIPPTITGVSGAKYNTTITLTAIGSKSAFESDGVCIDYYEWQLPDGSIVTGDSINYTMPDSSHVGDVLIFKCRAVDSLKNTSSWVTFNVSVLDKEPPTIGSVEIEDVLIDNHTYTITINASDPEGGSLQYKVSCNNSKVVISPSAWSSNNTFTITLPDFVTDTKIILTYHVSNDVAETTQAEEKIVYNNTTTLALIDSSYNTEEARGIVVDSKGHIFVCGWVSYNLFLLRAFNNFRNTKQITIDSGGSNNYLYGIAIDSSDNILVCGQANNLPYMGKFDNNVGLMKQITVDSGNSGELHDVIIGSNGNIFACGFWRNGSNSDFYIGKFSSDFIPVKQITIDSGDYNQLHGIVKDANNNVFVCGEVYIGSYWHLYLAKLDDDLNIVKQVTIDTGNHGRLWGIAVDSNGNIFVCGCANDNRLYIGKFSSDLNPVKQVTVDATYYHFTYGIHIDSDDNVYVVGQVADYFWVAKFDNDLNCLKQIIIRPKDLKGALFDVFVDSKKNVYVCGYKSDVNNKQDIFISKFTDFINYDGNYGYLLGSYLFIKKDVNYAFVEQNYTVTEQSYTFTEQSWSVIEQAWTPEERNFFVMIDHD